MSRNILFATWQYYPIPAGGAEHQAQMQAEALVRRNHRVTIVTPRTSGTASGWVNGVFVHRLPIIDRHPFRTVTYLLSLAIYLLLRLPRFDLVHVHLANTYADLIVLMGALLRRPVYVKLAAGGESGEVARQRRISWITRYYGIRHASRVQALSDEIELEVRSIGVSAERILRIPNGVDTTRFAPIADASRAEQRLSLALPEGEVLVLYTGRFSSYKGVPDLLDIWAGASPPSATLLLVGFRKDHPPEDQIAPPTDDDRLIVHEWATDTLPYLHSADIFVQPSHAEGMSNVLLEAMACGLPIVATRVGAAASMLQDGESGLLVEPGDQDGLRRALRSLIDEPELRDRLGAAAVRTIDERYSIEVIVDRIEAAYEEMLSSN